jgi:iron complex transport system substrate-binding protein
MPSAARRIRSSIASVLVLFYGSSFSQITSSDDLQRSVTLRSPAQRIVSLAPSITESLFALGAGEQVVGVTDYCNYPEAAQAKPSVGGITNPNVEIIVSLKPDLLLLSMEGNVRSAFEKLVSLGVPVFVTNPRSLNGIYHSILQLGNLTGRAESASQLVAGLRRRADSLSARAKTFTGTSVLFFVSLQPIIVVGRNTFLTELIALAGGANTAINAASSYPTYSREAVLKDNPDVLIFMADILPNRAALTTLFPEWSKLKAVREMKLFTIDPDIVSRPGPRAVEGLSRLFRLIHQN